MSRFKSDFAKRLEWALEACPDAPRQVHGRLTWIKRQLAERMGVEVSLNTVHKWARGMSVPRGDNLRALAKLLGVDEVWLALGAAGVDVPDPHVSPEAVPAHAEAAVLYVAGLLGLGGAEVTFAPRSEPGVSLHAAPRPGAPPRPILVLRPVEGDEAVTQSFIIPAPTPADTLILGVVRAGEPGRFEVLDLTAAPRTAHGGFSTIALTQETRDSVPRYLPSQEEPEVSG
ncbi:MAG: XRE family transcriptional regulator [Alphaproteobacteria bacterium]|nr:MAG: XRE family transcriptional regulator [Alphaproteobacteria bacterium]